VDCHTEADLKERLIAAAKAGRKLRVKLGVDPTSPDIHLGHSVVLRKMRQFQDLGHQAVLIIGNYTSLIGDPSGRSATRPVLTSAQVDENAKTYLDQVGKIIDVPSLEIVRNGDWFSTMQFHDVIKLAARFTVARILERDDFTKRMKEQKPISLHELLYPTMQAWDSVEVKADVELGGTDQTYNLLAGRDLMRGMEMAGQIALTTPILSGRGDQRKMSKSYGNAIGVSEPPEEMYGKVLSITDDQMAEWYTLLTLVPEAEFTAAIASDPNAAKHRLAREITTFYHGAAGADAGAEHFQKVVKDKSAPDEVPSTVVGKASIGLLNALVTAGLAKSNSEARRLVADGAVRVADEVVSDPATMLATGTHRIRKGKRGWHDIVVE
jgi:tyrosyl-tRNA synthetase